MTTSETARRVILEEERRGYRLANGMRYVFAFLLLVLGLASTAENAPADRAANLFFLGLYLAVTVAHSVILVRCGIATERRFAVFALFADFAVICAVLVYYLVRVQPGNLAFLVKNDSLLLLLLPLEIAALQFRPRLLLAGLITLTALLTLLITAGVLTGMPLTTNWKEYVLGPSVHLLAKITIWPVWFGGAVFTLWFLIRRSLAMTRRTADLEAAKGSLARYFSPAVVEAITADPDGAGVGARQRVAVLFADVRGFTALTEQMPVELLVKRLARFREALLAAVFAHGGTRDKYIGDAVMATFGTPKPSSNPDDDVRRAYACGLAMREAAAAWNEAEGLTDDHPDASKRAWRLGIGLHVGEVIAGTVGTAADAEWTVIGDAVNTASRVEGLTKVKGADFLLTGEVAERLRDEDRRSLRFLGPEEVRGKSRTVDLYAAPAAGRGST